LITSITLTSANVSPPVEAQQRNISCFSMG
jgi:hypothetical protein